MGSWNHTCLASHLHVRDDEEVVSLFLVENRNWNSLCYTTALWAPLPILVYGKYNDYGAVHEFTGKYDQMLLDLVKKNMIEFEQGENKYHDVAATKEGLDMEQMYELDHENRLWIKTHQDYVTDEVVQAWAKQGVEIKNNRFLNPGLHLKHVVIKKSFFDKLLTDFYWDECDWKDRTNYTGYYRYKFYFKDAVANIDEDVKKIREALSPKEGETEFEITMRLMRSETLLWALRDEVKLMKLLPARGFNSQEGGYYVPKFDFWVKMKEMCHEEAVDFIMEMAKMAWLQAYMDLSRTIWVPMGGAGSQSQELAPYELMGNYLLKQVAAERAEYEAENGDEEEGEEA